MKKEIIKILSSIFAENNEGFIEIYKKNLNVLEKRVIFTLEINPIHLKIIERFNTLIELKLKEKYPNLDIKFLITSHNNLKSSDLQNDKIAKYIIPIASGKGGVGKSTTSINLALALKSQNYNVGILDADIYGPSLPKLTKTSIKPKFINKKIIPHNIFGLQSMSIGFLIPEDSATIWRGPMVMSAINQLLNDVSWNNLDFLIIDMPPGTGDAQLTLSQKVQLAGAIIVSTPQDIALIDARKGLNMFKKVNVPILGIIENMSYFICDKCDKKHFIFDNGGAKKEANKIGVPFLGALPIDKEVRKTSDLGNPIFHKNPNHEISKIFKKIANNIVEQVKKKQVSFPEIVIN